MPKKNKIQYNEPLTKTKISINKFVENSDEKNIIFCFSEIVLLSEEDKCSLIKTKEESHAFLARVAKLSRFTWRDIKKENHKSYGFELIPFEQINGYTKIINKLKNNGHKSFYVFRVKNSSISRILGVREGFIFKIFFYDTQGLLYNHGS